MRTQRVALGMAFVGAAGVTIYGGVTGRLAPMLGAVFAPTTLEPGKDSDPSVIDRVADVLGGAADRLPFGRNSIIGF